MQSSKTVGDAPLARISGELTPRAPFDFSQTLSFLRRFTPTAGEQRLTDESLTRGIALSERAVVFSVRSVGVVEQPRLAYTLTSAEPLSEAEHTALRDRISFALSLDDDLGAFYQFAQGDTAMQPVVARLYGLHQPKFLTPFELACWAILTQRTPIPIARQIKQRLAARYGVELAVAGIVYRAFPEVATLASADPAELAEIVRNARKANYLLAVIQFFDEVDEAWLRSAPVEEVQARLRGVRGIGEWSAMFLLVRGLGRMDAMPVSDGELQRSAAQLYNAGQPLPSDAFARLLERYGDVRGYWAFYIRNAIESGSGRSE
jgi:DNA-3-methyladenine glycosylase II